MKNSQEFILELNDIVHFYSTKHVDGMK